MAAERPPRIVGLGEYLFDEFPDSRRPGGAPANVAFHAAQLGAEGIVCTRVGDDADGTALRDHLRAHGLGTRAVQRDPMRPTGTVSVHLARNDGPAYTIHESVAWDYIEPAEDWPELFGGAAALCFGSLAQRGLTSRLAILRALEMAPRALKVFDINLRPPHYTREVIEVSMARCDVVKLNADEVEVLQPLLELPARGLHDFAATLIERFGLRLVCVTRGAQGCLAIGENETAHMPAEPVEVADTVGAGDAFTAALSYGLVQQWPLAQAARFANGVGGLVASRAGAMPALSAEYARLKAALR